MPVMALQGAFTSGELSPSLSARVDLAKYQQGCRTLKNFLVQPHGGAVKRPGFLLLDELPGEAVLLRMAFNTEQAYCLAFGEKWLRVAVADGMILGADGGPYHLASPYTLAQARRLSCVQSGDVVFLACAGARPHKLKRLAHNDWAFEAMRFTCPIDAPEGVSVKGVNNAQKSDGTAQSATLVTPYEYIVTAVNADGRESEAGQGAAFTGPASNCWYSGYHVAVTWAAVPDAEEYRVYKKEFGGRAGYIGATGECLFHDYNTSPVFSDGPPVWKDPFPEDDFPAVVAFFEQRLVFASSEKRPQTLWMSRSGDYDNFSSSVPLKADDALELTLASGEVSAARWMVALRSMILGAAGMEWEIKSTEGAFTARTARADPQSYRGSAALPALVVGNAVLHVTRSGREVRDLKYDFGADSYGGTDRTILAAHLLEGRRIIGWTYQPAPDSIVWCVRDDGVLLGMTYQPEHEVFAWHQHQTQGTFKSVVSVPKGGDDGLFAVVERFGRYFLEIMAPRFDPEHPEQAVFLDGALQYRGPAVTEAGVPAHLEGRTVGILADRAAQAARVARHGAVTLDAPAETVTVGLAYDADLETMPVELAGESGASVGRKKTVHAVTVLFKDTVTARVGCDFRQLETVKWRKDEPYDSPPAPYSGAHRVIVPEFARATATVCIRSDAPLPMTVLALMPEVEVK